MLECVKKMLSFLEGNFNDIFLYVVLMVSAIIVTIGLLKPLLYNRIKSKQIRKVALAFSNIALCFICAFVLFVIEGWNLKYYLTAAIALTVCSIVTYWLYENTCLRNLIATVGNIVLKKVANIALVTMNTADIKEIKNEVIKATDELKLQTKQELKKTALQIKEDKDLKEL